MSKTLTIRIPFDLARLAVWQRRRVNKYDTNRLIKCLDTWLVLKAETCSGLLQDWNKQKQHILSLCKITESIFRARLRMLKDLRLVDFDRHHIRLASWEDLARILEIDTKQSLTIQYNTDDKSRVQDWIIATEIKDNQTRQGYAVMKKVNKNADLKLMFSHAILKAGADRARIKDDAYFLQWLLILYRESFVRPSDIHDLLIQNRPDVNRGVKTIAETWKARHPQTVCYWKKVLKDAGIIDVGKLQIQSQERARNEFCKVLWLKSAKQTLLCVCDQLTLLMPWTVCTNNTTNKNFSLNEITAS